MTYEHDEEYYDDEDQAKEFDDLLDFAARNYVIPAEKRRYRQFFLDAVKDLAPEVLHDLRQLALRPPERRRRSNLDAPATPLERWAHRYRLYDFRTGAGGWVVVAASRTLEYWKNHPDQEALAFWSPDAANVVFSGSLDYGLPGSRESKALLARLESPFRFECVPWDPTGQKWGEYKRQATADFERALERERRRVAEILQKGSTDKAPQKRNVEHFKWLVLYQVNKMTYYKISKSIKSEPISHQTVLEAVASTAKLLFGYKWSTWLRHSPRRRPRSKPRERPRPVSRPAEVEDEEE